MPRRPTFPRGTTALLAGVLGLAAISTLVGSASSLAVSTQALTTFSTCTLTAADPTTAIVDDAEVREARANGRFGTATTLTVTSRSGRNERAYIRFDLAACVPAIAASSAIRLATLRLYLTAIPTSCRTLDLFPVTSSWTERQITWNKQPLGTVINDPPTLARTDSFDVGAAAGCENRVVDEYLVGADVTTDAADAVAGGASDIGWMIRDDAEDDAPAATVEFASKEAGVLARAPQLVVTYVNAP